MSFLIVTELLNQLKGASTRKAWMSSTARDYITRTYDGAVVSASTGS